MEHLSSRGFRTVATGVVDGNLKVYFYGTGATMTAAGLGSQSFKPTTVFLAEFLFFADERRLSAKFKCTDEGATGTFVRVRVGSGSHALLLVVCTCRLC